MSLNEIQTYKMFCTKLRAFEQTTRCHSNTPNASILPLPGNGILQDHDSLGNYSLERREDALEDCARLDSLLSSFCPRLSSLQDLLDDPRITI